MKVFNKVVILLLLVICGQCLFAQERAITVPIYINTVYTNNTFCDVTDAPSLKSLTVTFPDNKSVEIGANKFGEKKEITINDIEDENGFILKDKNKCNLSFNGEISHDKMIGKSSYEAIDDDKELIVGANELKANNSCNCGIAGHTESYDLKVVAYVDFPPCVKEIPDAITNNKYSADKPLRIKLNNYYSTDDTECKVHVSFDGTNNYYDLETYDGYFVPNGEICIYYSDLQTLSKKYNKTFKDLIYIRFKKTTNIVQQTKNDKKTVKSVTYSDVYGPVNFLKPAPAFYCEAYKVSEKIWRLYIVTQDDIDNSKFEFVFKTVTPDNSTPVPLPFGSIEMKDIKIGNSKSVFVKEIKNTDNDLTEITITPLRRFINYLAKTK